MKQTIQLTGLAQRPAIGSRKRSSHKASVIAKTLLATATFTMCIASSLLAMGTDLRVSSNGRYLERTTDGGTTYTPFFWLGDTGWFMPTRANRADVELYLNNRQSKGVNVVQIVVHGERAAGGTRSGPVEGNPVNRYGHRPFTGTVSDPNTASPLTVTGGTPDSPNDFWDHMDFIVRETKERGMHLAIWPVWGLNWIKPDQKGSIQYTAAEAKSHGKFIGSRYRNESHIIWGNGGDTSPTSGGTDCSAVYRALAEGICEGVSGVAVAYNQSNPAWNTVLMCYHPPSDPPLYFKSDAWLDFYMVQTGQSKPGDVVPYTNAAYGATPTKPVILGEVLYEGMVTWATTYDGNSAIEVRRSIYQGWLSGARGYTYGCHSSTITAFDDVYAFGPAGTGNWEGRLNIGCAMDLPHVKSLLTGRAWHSLVPDQTIISAGAGSGSTQKRASKLSGELLVYYPNNTTANIKNILRTSADAKWFDPRAGTTASAGTFAAGATRTMLPPTGWEDSVLILTAFGGQGAVTHP